MSLISTFRQIINFGTRGIKDPSLRFDIALINTSCLFGGGACLITFLISLSVNNFAYQAMNLITAVVCLVPIWTNYKEWTLLSKSILIWVIPALMISYSYLFGNMGADYYIFVGMSLGIYLFRFEKRGIFLSVGISSLGFILSKWLIWSQGNMVIEGLGLYLFFPNLIFCLMAIGWLTDRYRNHYQTQNARINSLHESRGRLLSVLSHDLRSPLHNIQHLVDQLESGEAIDSERQRKVVALISDSLKSTSLLLDNATYWINSEGDQLVAKSNDLVLNSLVEETTELFLPIANQKGISILNTLEVTYLVKGDKNIIKMVLRNLLSNAVKFSPEGSKTIEVITRLKDDMLWLGVRDYGFGLEAADIEFLMSNKRQLDDGTNKEEGTGMGLVLIKYFLTLMNSELRLESQSNEGTTIWVSLPFVSQQSDQS